MAGEGCPVVLDRTGADIHAEAARLRAHGPVTEVELPDGVRGWSITGQQQIRSALTDTRISKDPRRNWSAYADGTIGPGWPLADWLTHTMTTSDGADHSRIRKLVARAFTARRVELLRPRVTALVDRLLDELAQEPPGAVVDLRERYGYPLPAEVICELFGVPEEDRGIVLRGGEANTDTSIDAEQARRNVELWQQEIGKLVEARRKEPGDDLTSVLIRAQESDGTALTEAELHGTLNLVLSAGSATVTNLFCNAIVALLRHPDQLALVRGGAVGWPEAIEEVLRAESPIAQLPFRFAVEEVELGGVVIPPGEPILVGYAGAGRDPEVHGASADRFDVTRENKEHLSFGFGVHHCVGATLAQLEAGIALPALFARFPELELAVEPDELRPRGSFIMNGHDAVPVRLTPSAGTGASS